LDHSKNFGQITKSQSAKMETAKWIPHKLKTVKVVSNLQKSIKKKIHRAREILLLLNAPGQNGSK
jgi:hypothetical protein